MYSTSTVTNPVYANAEKTAISCLVQFDHIPDPVPFIASALDPEAHGRQLYAELTALAYGQIAPYVAPVKG